MREMRNKMPLNLEDELLTHELDKAMEGVDDAAARGDDRAMAEWKLVVDDLGPRVDESEEFHSL